MEDGTLPEKPQINAFHKASTAVIGDGDTMVLPDAPASIFEGEAEMAIVIGKRAKNVSQADAMKHIFGYINFIDGSARGLPPQSFFHMKSRDTFAPIGPWLVTADEVPDPQNLPMWLKVNGQTMQNGSTATMVYGAAFLVSYLSQFFTLHPGDIISTGTPPGVGMGMKPPRYLTAGDVVELGIEGLGSQKQTCLQD